MAPLGTILASAAAATLAARDFSYHDNAVRLFTPNTKYFHTYANFTVTDFSISAGQDPHTVNHVGDFHQTMMIRSDPPTGMAALLDLQGEPRPEPGFVFTVGRHKTPEVAEWWNARVPPNSNTFGKAADQLNFAFIGDLDYLITGPYHDNVTTVHVPGIAFAQGSDDNGSNWWVGGKNCTYGLTSRPDTVICKGYHNDKAQYPIDVWLQRGSTGQVNDVFIMD